MTTEPLSPKTPTIYLVTVQDARVVERTYAIAVPATLVEEDDVSEFVGDQDFGSLSPFEQQTLASNWEIVDIRSEE